MFVKVSRLELKKAISIAKGFLPAKPLIEVDGYILFTLDDKELVVSATDNQQVCYAKLEVLDSEGKGEFSCDPKRIEKILIKSSCIDIKLIYDEEKQSLKIDIGEGDKESFSTLHSLETERMSSFRPSTEGKSEPIVVNREILSSALKYIQVFAPEPNFISKKYDFAIIENGIMYAANGVNRRGYFICRQFKDISGIHIQKKFLKNLARVLPILECENISLIDRKNVITLESDDGNYTIHLLKSRNVPPDITRQYVNLKDDPYTIINKDHIIKSLDRSSVADYSKVGTPIGIQLTISGEGVDATLKTDLITSKLDNIDTIPCQRVGDEGEEVSHIIDYKLFKTILSSFSKEGDTRLYMNDPELRFFKIYTKSSVGDIPYAEIGVGAFSRKAR